MRRAQYIEKIINSLDSYPLEEFTVRRMAEILGTSPMALYKHFKNKQVLLASIAFEGFLRLEIELNQIVETQAPSQRDLIQSMIICYYNYGNQYPNLYRLMFGNDTINFQSHQDLVDQANGVMDILIQAIGLVCTKNNLKLKTDSEHEASIYLWSSVHGVVMSQIDNRVAYWRFNFDIDKYASFLESNLWMNSRQ